MSEVTPHPTPAEMEKLLTKLQERVIFGHEHEGQRQHSKDECHDCGAIYGQLHEEGCDWEECAICQGQRISCGCRGDILSESFPDILAYIRTLKKEHREMLPLLKRSLVKLRVYHGQTNGEYGGGENLSWLTDDIEKVLSSLKP